MPDAAAVRRAAIADVRTVARQANVDLSRVLLSIDSCGDSDSGSQYRASVTADYPGGSGTTQSQQLVSQWQTALRTHGWASDPALVTHNGIVLARGGAELAMHYVDPRAVNDVPSFEYSGPCHALQGGSEAKPARAEDVTSDVMS